MAAGGEGVVCESVAVLGPERHKDTFIIMATYNNVPSVMDLPAGSESAFSATEGIVSDCGLKVVPAASEQFILLQVLDEGEQCLCTWTHLQHEVASYQQLLRQ